MFRDLNEYRSGREPPPRKHHVSLTWRQQKILMYAVLLELFFLFIAPICGASMIDAVMAVLK